MTYYNIIYLLCFTRKVFGRILTFDKYSMFRYVTVEKINNSQNDLVNIYNIDDKLNRSIELNKSSLNTNGILNLPGKKTIKSPS